MYIAPVGIVNAGDAEGAYAEAIDMAGAHQSSYGREAAGVLAAAVAEAMGAGATVDSVLDVAVGLAKDGTREAIVAMAEAGRAVDAETKADWFSFARSLRAAVEPWDTVGPVYREPALDSRKPSRTKAIEELPVALGFLAATAGDYRSAVLGAVNYGRDSDSIAGMVGTLCGALGGSAAVPAEWIDAVGAASKVDLREPGRVLAGVARKMATDDQTRWTDRLARRNGSLVNA